MSIALYRIDERLLHGQVIVGWGQRLGVDRYIVVDDPIASTEWEQGLYASAVPEDVEVLFLDVAEAVERLPEFEASDRAAILLTGDTKTMRELSEAGALEGKQVNIGGLHAGGDRRRALDYIFLSSQEAEDLKRIRERAAAVSARDLPGSHEVPLDKLLDRRGRARS